MKKGGKKKDRISVFHFSDTHEVQERILKLERVFDQHFDIIIFTGDMLWKKKPCSTWNELLQRFDDFRKNVVLRFRSYKYFLMIYGNHDIEMIGTTEPMISLEYKFKNLKRIFEEETGAGQVLLLEHTPCEISIRGQNIGVFGSSYTFREHKKKFKIKDYKYLYHLNNRDKFSNKEKFRKRKEKFDRFCHEQWSKIPVQTHILMTHPKPCKSIGLSKQRLRNLGNNLKLVCHGHQKTEERITEDKKKGFFMLNGDMKNSVAVIFDLVIPSLKFKFREFLE